jgi:RNA polymerase sigma factor (sigma-70 family)
MNTGEATPYIETYYDTDVDDTTDGAYPPFSGPLIPTESRDFYEAVLATPVLDGARRDELIKEISTIKRPEGALHSERPGRTEQENELIQGNLHLAYYFVLRTYGIHRSKDSKEPDRDSLSLHNLSALPLSFDERFSLAVEGLEHAVWRVASEEPLNAEFSTVAFRYMKNRIATAAKKNQKRRRATMSGGTDEIPERYHPYYPESKDPLDAVNKTEEVRSLLLQSGLTNREKSILAGVYYHGLTQEEIGEIHNISRVRVGQIKQEALNKIREAALAREGDDLNDGYYYRKTIPASSPEGVVV